MRRTGRGALPSLAWEIARGYRQYLSRTEFARVLSHVRRWPNNAHGGLATPSRGSGDDVLVRRNALIAGLRLAAGDAKWKFFAEPLGVFLGDDPRYLDAGWAHNAGIESYVAARLLARAVAPGRRGAPSAGTVADRARQSNERAAMALDAATAVQRVAPQRTVDALLGRLSGLPHSNCAAAGRGGAACLDAAWIGCQGPIADLVGSRAGMATRGDRLALAGAAAHGCSGQRTRRAGGIFAVAAMVDSDAAVWAARGHRCGPADARAWAPSPRDFTLCFDNVFPLPLHCCPTNDLLRSRRNRRLRAPPTLRSAARASGLLLDGVRATRFDPSHSGAAAGHRGREVTHIPAVGALINWADAAGCDSAWNGNGAAARAEENAVLVDDVTGDDSDVAGTMTNDIEALAEALLRARPVYKHSMELASLSGGQPYSYDGHASRNDGDTLPAVASVIARRLPAGAFRNVIDCARQLQPSITAATRALEDGFEAYAAIAKASDDYNGVGIRPVYGDSTEVALSEYLKTVLMAGAYKSRARHGCADEQRDTPRPDEAVAVVTWEQHRGKGSPVPREEYAPHHYAEVTARAYALALASCFSQCTQRSPHQLACGPPLRRYGHAISHTLLAQERGREARQPGEADRVLNARGLAPSVPLPWTAITGTGDDGGGASAAQTVLSSAPSAMDRTYVSRALERAAIDRRGPLHVVRETISASLRIGCHSSHDLWHPESVAGMCEVADNRGLWNVAMLQWLAQTGYGLRASLSSVQEIDRALTFARNCFAWRRHGTCDGDDTVEECEVVAATMPGRGKGKRDIEHALDPNMRTLVLEDVTCSDPLLQTIHMGDRRPLALAPSDSFNAPSFLPREISHRNATPAEDTVCPVGGESRPLVSADQNSLNALCFGDTYAIARQRYFSVHLDFCWRTHDGLAERLQQTQADGANDPFGDFLAFLGDPSVQSSSWWGGPDGDSPHNTDARYLNADSATLSQEIPVGLHQPDITTTAQALAMSRPGVWRRWLHRPSVLRSLPATLRRKILQARAEVCSGRTATEPQSADEMRGGVTHLKTRTLRDGDQRRWRALFVQDGSKHNIGLFPTAGKADNSYNVATGLIHEAHPSVLGDRPPTFTGEDAAMGTNEHGANAARSATARSSAVTTASGGASVYDPSSYDASTLEQFYRHVLRRVEHVAPMGTTSENHAAITFLETQRPRVSAFVTFSSKNDAYMAAQSVLGNPFNRWQIEGWKYRPRPLLEHPPTEQRLPADVIPGLVYHTALDKENLRRIGIAILQPAP